MNVLGRGCLVVGGALALPLRVVALRLLRWPGGVICPRCSADSVIKNGRDDTEADRQRSECKDCRQRFDDLTDPIFAGHHQPLRTGIACLYLMGLNLSGLPIAQELD